MKKIAILLSLFVVGSASADDGTGWIMGINGGYAHIHYQPDSYASYVTPTSGVAAEVKKPKALAYNFYIGYRLYRELGWELGYMQFKTATFTYNGTPSQALAKRYDYNFLIRGDYPLTRHINGFIKGGIARVNSRVEANDGYTTNVAAWTPVYGLGFGYNLSEHTEFNAQWLHINPVKVNAHSSGVAAPDVPTANYFSVGWMYRF